MKNENVKKDLSEGLDRSPSHTSSRDMLGKQLKLTRRTLEK